MEHTIEMISPKNLIAYKNNSRTHSKEQINQIENSIKEFGFTNPVLLDKNNEIIAGHGRVLASKKMGIKEVPCLRLSHLTEQQKRAYVIADNQLALNAGWDENILSLEIGDLSDNDFDISLLGFNDLDLNKYLLKEFDGLTDEDEVPEPPKEPITKLGDIWQLGNHRLMCGDATKEECVNNLMDGAKSDICFTSPPYNADKNSHLTGYVKGFDKKYINSPDNLSDDKYLELIKKSTIRALAISKYVFVNLQLLTHNRIPLIEFLYYFKNKLKDILIWNKSIAPPNIVKGSFNTKYEFLFCIANDMNTRGFPCSWQGKYSNVIETESNSTNEFANKHKAGFPVSFPLWVIEKMDFSMSVYDCFMGTGTTLIACEKLNRICYGMELDPIYCDVTIKRWENFTGKKAELLNE